MKVVQLVPTLLFGDAVGNNVLTLDMILKQLGYESYIYTENIGKRIDKDLVKYAHELEKLDEEDILLYHCAVESISMEKIIKKQICKKVMIYHNITPAKFFEPYNVDIAKNVTAGREQLRRMSSLFDYVLAASEYNKRDLIKEGYKCKIDVLPILVALSDYEKEPDYNLIKKFDDDYVNILFVGRINPNKKQEDIIREFAYYHKYVNNKSRLFLVGSYDGMEIYYSTLVRYVAKLDLQDSVIFSGHISFAQILSYYHIADVFLCMSEHEGFCVPLVEAMKLKVPIIAYSEAAVPDTLGDSGIVVDRKDPKYISSIIDVIVSDTEFKDRIIAAQSNKLKDYYFDTIAEKFREYLEYIISETFNKESEYDCYVKGKLLTISINDSDEKKILEYTVEDNFNSDDDIVVSTTLKQKIKYKILKPVYKMLACINQPLADKIRACLYKINDMLK
jgi:glycosyltransferase involved in cell wall biosynthesis